MITVHDSAREGEPEVLGALARLLELVRLCELEATGGTVPDLYAARLARDFDAFARRFDLIARTLPADAAIALGAEVRRRMRPLVERADNARRWLVWPRGHAGDFETIVRIDRDVSGGDGVVGTLLDRCFLALPAILALPLRRRVLTDELRADVMRMGGPLRVTSLGCGPATELFALRAVLGPGPSPVIATLVDADPAALAHCAAERARTGLRDDAVQLVEADPVGLAVGREAIELAGQDLVYCVGPLDQLGDSVVVKLLDFIHGALRPGGRVIVGNVHVRNPSRAIMDHVLDWQLVHRSESDLRRLFSLSRFGTCGRLSYEPARIHMLAESFKL